MLLRPKPGSMPPTRKQIPVFSSKAQPVPFFSVDYIVSLRYGTVLEKTKTTRKQKQTSQHHTVYETNNIGDWLPQKRKS